MTDLNLSWNLLPILIEWNPQEQSTPRNWLLIFVANQYGCPQGRANNNNQRYLGKPKMWCASFALKTSELCPLVLLSPAAQDWDLRPSYLQLSATEGTWSGWPSLQLRIGCIQEMGDGNSSFPRPAGLEQGSEPVALRKAGDLCSGVCARDDLPSSS